MVTDANECLSLVQIRLRTITVPMELTGEDGIDHDDSETIVVQTSSIQEGADHVNLSINHNPATVETEAEALLADKARESAKEQEKSGEPEKGEAILEPDTVESLLETARKSFNFSVLGGPHIHTSF